jgi:hypothetical protein
MSTADQLREITKTFQIHKKLDRNEILAALYALIDLAERVERLEEDRGGGS